MRKSKYDNGDNPTEDNPMDELSYIEKTTFLADQCNRIDRQLKEIESLYTMVSSLRYELDAAVRKMNKILPAFDAQSAAQRTSLTA